MSVRVYTSSGGGVRIGGTFGALLEGERQGKFNVKAFDVYVGTSAGALDAALSANGWNAQAKAKLFLETDFGKFFTPFLMPFGMRKAFTVMKPIPLTQLENFYQSLTGPNPFGPPLRFGANLLINTVDAKDNIQVVYCTQIPDWASAQKDPEDGLIYTYRLNQQGKPRKVIRWEVGTTKLATAMVRSSVLPGLVADDDRYMDGGIAENPLLSLFPADSEILLVHLGYPGLLKHAGDQVPRGILNRAMYAYEFKAYQAAEHLMAHYPKMKVVYPGILDEDSANFGLPRSRKQKMLDDGAVNSQAQWEAL